MIEWFNIIQAAASIATAGGVFVAAAQLYYAGRQSRTRFEDSLTQQYLNIVADLPFEVMLGEEIGEPQLQTVLKIFYMYFNLCNEQIMWRRQGRISTETWENWRDGMRSNFERRPAFTKAWKVIQDRSDNFTELRLLERKGFTSDPRKWRSEDFLSIGSNQSPPVDAVVKLYDEQDNQLQNRIGR